MHGGISAIALQRSWVLYYAAARPCAVVASTEVREAASMHQFRQLEAFTVFNLLEKLRMPNFASYHHEEAHLCDLHAVAFPVFHLSCANKTEEVANITLCAGCRSIVALLVAVPEMAGASLTSELYSPHLDVHQRMLILETLATAAQQMANPRLRLGAGRGQTGSQSDKLGVSDAPSSGRVADEGGIMPAVSCRP